jgi:V/A-type H+-transporting ATPase subunit D
MKKIKLTKTELKTQKNSLKRYKRYLPILNIKKQQLQREMEGVRIELERTASEFNRLMEEIIPWICLLGEEVGLSDLIILKEIETGVENIAGVDIPVFVKAHIDSKMIFLQAEESVHMERLHLLEQELNITSQRVNLFEKVKIPEAKAAIRQISIFLGDQQAAAVGWARIAKKKIQGVHK